VWDAQNETLLWVDLPVGELHMLRSGRDTTIARMPEPLSAVFLRRNGGLALAAQSGLYLTDRYGPDGVGDVTLLTAFENASRTLWPNDGCCDPAGRAWLGLTHIDGVHGAGSLLCITPDGSITVSKDGLTLPNGLGWTADGRHMYFIESSERALYRFRVDTTSGELLEEHVVARFDQALGVPDGLAIDLDDHIWVAFYGEGVLRRLAPSGETTDEAFIGVPEVTSCCFGDPSDAILYVTTGDWNRSGRRHAGAVFSLTVDVAGAPVARFAG
jgi:sugar lactone lactonase YvrE